MDICAHRPLLVTCSKDDATVRIWNYINYKCELARVFLLGHGNNLSTLEPLHTIAFHPTG